MIPDIATYMRPTERAYQGAAALDRAYGPTCWARLVNPTLDPLCPTSGLCTQIAAAFAWPDDEAEELRARTLAALFLDIHTADPETRLLYHGLLPVDEADRVELGEAWRALIAQRTPAGWWS